MNAFETQDVRDKYRITWQEEYIIGMINSFGEATTTQVFKGAEYSRVMTQATTHKYLKSAVYRKMIKEVKLKEDQRVHVLTLTDRGREFLHELEGV